MRGGIRRENRGESREERGIRRIKRGESREKTKRQVFGMGDHFEHLP